jgi:plastocyanin
MPRMRSILSHAWPLATALAPLVLVALFFASCGGGGKSSSPTSPVAGNTIKVSVVDDAFVPKDITINPGDTVIWTMNSTAPLHTVTDNNGTFDSGTMLSTNGATFSHTFTQSNSTVNYHCKVHQACCQMQGSVTVGQGPPPIAGY